MRKEEVIEKIGRDNWIRFSKFMIGQTISINDDKTYNYYKCDVDNFIHLLKTGRTMFFD